MLENVKICVLFAMLLAAANYMLSPNLYSSKKIMKHDLVLMEEQAGMGGKSVRTWTIKKDGRWTVKDSFDGETEDVSSGTLTGKQLKRVINIIKENELVKLPQDMGSPAKVNPHTYVLVFDKKYHLHGTPPQRKGTMKGHILFWASVQNGKGFAEIVDVIVESCK